MKKLFTPLLLSVLLSPVLLLGQSRNLEALYEQASESSGLVVQYTQDVRNINYVFGGAGGGQFGPTRAVANSPEQRERLVQLNNDYIKKLDAADFEKMSIHGKVDYVMLRRSVEENLRELIKERERYAGIEDMLGSFATTIYKLESQRRRGAVMDGQKVAGLLDQASKDLADVKAKVEKIKQMDQEKARLAAGVVDGLKSRLKNIFDFYNGYDPLFTWWVSQPYKKLDKELGDYSKLIASKSDAKPFDDGSGIGGQPIGSSEFNRLLKMEMIDYTPEELKKLAQEEFAWCEAELLKASREMGFGEDWRAAQEKVKNTYVAAGEQPDLIVKLYWDANNFIKENNLFDVPALSHDTWGMTMMTPERQLVAPFFLGGRDILIAYPTDAMDHEHKLMSMRGNNPYFSRGIVQHELVPGHHLQYFMNSRYKTYRADAFRTPFWSEGWALYWELLLYDKGFAKTPEEKMGMLFWRMHRCARIIFSINYHLGEWTPQQCVDYLVDRVGHERSTAHAEVKRSFEGGYGPLYQLAYMMGGIQFFALQKELVGSGKMSYNDFHTMIMKQNQLPVEMVRATLINQDLKRDFKPEWKFYENYRR